MGLIIGFDRDGIPNRTADEIEKIIAALQTQFNTQTTSQASSVDSLKTGLVPVGTTLLFAGSTAPGGYLLCDGSAVSRTTYGSLFAVVGTTYGAGDGSTTFNIPDLRGRFPLGVATGGTGSSLGSTGGAIDHTHTGGSVSGSTASESSHTHSIDPPDTLLAYTEKLFDADNVGVTANAVFSTASNYPHTDIASFTSGAGSSHSHGAGTLAIGTSGTANPPFVAMNYVIKT